MVGFGREDADVIDVAIDVVGAAELHDAGEQRVPTGTVGRDRRRPLQRRAHGDVDARDRIHLVERVLQRRGVGEVRRDARAVVVLVRDRHERHAELLRCGLRLEGALVPSAGNEMMSPLSSFTPALTENVASAVMSSAPIVEVERLVERSSRRAREGRRLPRSFRTRSGLPARVTRSSPSIFGRVRPMAFTKTRTSAGRPAMIGAFGFLASAPSAHDGGLDGLVHGDLVDDSSSAAVVAGAAGAAVAAGAGLASVVALDPQPVSGDEESDDARATESCAESRSCFASRRPLSPAPSARTPQLASRSCRAPL